MFSVDKRWEVLVGGGPQRNLIGVRDFNQQSNIWDDSRKLFFLLKPSWYLVYFRFVSEQKTLGLQGHSLQTKNRWKSTLFWKCALNYFRHVTSLSRRIRKDRVTPNTIGTEWVLMPTTRGAGLSRPATGHSSYTFFFWSLNFFYRATLFELHFRSIPLT